MGFVVFGRKKIIIAISLVAFLVITTILFSVTNSYAVFYGYANRELPIYSVQTQEKKIAISFDCAWGDDYTLKLLEIMEKENVKCTFFMVEFWAEKYPYHVKTIYDSGHEIGTHSSTHPYMSKLDKATIIKELTSSSKKISDITDDKVEVFRPPYGDYNDLLIRTARELGLYTVQWSVDSLDWKNLSAIEIENRVCSKIKNGSIVLFHNQGLHTAEALPKIIKRLKADGYEFVPIGKLIYRDNYKMGADGTQIKND